ncbi:MarR family winged helix-turn-helix transcriptional regulator [Sphingomonas sp. LaA6.9]|uniref:MarR family winged helix-turn-helix transcriptional regulator n=1 Tax=Sphingomonas sp. LaA6.9 TaxID=2919914 RepID=UPI00247983A1|nr:MarR family transcriptional regulator [Sphingomonas sp. LaA6.9]
MTVSEVGKAAPAAKSGDVKLGLLADHLAFYLRRAQDVSFQAFAKRVNRTDLCPGHFTILTIIGENPGLNQTALSQATGRDKSTLTPALKALEQQGTITRTRSEVDRRAYLLKLTPAGEDYLAQLTVHAHEHGRLLDEVVGPFNKPLLIHLLEEIAQKLPTKA